MPSQLTGESALRIDLALHELRIHGERPLPPSDLKEERGKERANEDREEGKLSEERKMERQIRAN